MLQSLKQKAWSQLADTCDNRKGETLREWIPHTGLNGVKQAYTEATTWCCISNKSAFSLVHSPPLCPFAYDLMQDPGVKDTPIDPQREMEFSIKILPTSKISLPLNRRIKKIFLPCIRSIAVLPSPKELNWCVSQKS